jgi:hypothetical protein
MTWAEEDQKIKRTTGWTVCRKYPQGSSLAAKAILNFWTSDLKALSNSLKEQPQLPVPTLCERPFYKIGRYNFQFPWVVAQQNNLTAVVNNLRRIGARRTGQMSETRRIELRLADQLRQRGFAVEVGYQPERTEQEDPGEVDLICYRDGLATACWKSSLGTFVQIARDLVASNQYPAQGGLAVEAKTFGGCGCVDAR